MSVEIITAVASSRDAFAIGTCIVSPRVGNGEGFSYAVKSGA